MKVNREKAFIYVFFIGFMIVLWTHLMTAFSK